MRKLYVILILSLSLSLSLSLLLTSCQTFKQFEGDCKIDKDKFYNDATALLLRNDVKITLSDNGSGLLLAERMDTWHGLVKITLQYNDGRVTFNIADGTRNSFDDGTKYELYHTIKRGLESMCDSPLHLQKSK